MFTGLIQEIGRIGPIRRTANGLTYTVKAPASAGELNLGDSISVAGVCQTVESISGESFTTTAIPETLSKTTLGDITTGDMVNLELALRLGDRMGGHAVSGHVDTVGTVTDRNEGKDGVQLTLSFAEVFSLWVIKQGSVSIDGVSLTVADTGDDVLTVALIPETLTRTTLGQIRRGDPVNLEFDQTIKAVVQTVQKLNRKTQPVTEQTLADAGW